MTPHPIDAVSTLKKQKDNVYLGQTLDKYSNMAGPFGGATAATLMRAIIEHPDRKGDPVSFTVNFCAAIKNGEFTVFTELQRSGRYIQHWNIRLEQEGVVCATASLVCGQRVETFRYHPANSPEAPNPEDCEILDTSSFLGWLQCYEFRPFKGSYNFRNTPFETPQDPHTMHWVRDNPERALDYVSLAALSDSFVLRLLFVRGYIVPTGTVSMTTHFHAGADELAEQGSQHLLGTATGHRFGDNFHDQTMQLWGQNGKLLASGTQIVWFKE